METVLEECQRAWRVHEYIHGFFARAMNLAEPMPTNTNQNPLDLNEKVFLKGICTIPRFESMMVQARTHQTMMVGYRLNVMTQAPYVEDKGNLPVGVYMVLTYSELQDGSQSVAVVLMQALQQEGGLDELTLECIQKFEQMLMEYHDVFSLDKDEIGCMDAAEHIIELLDDEPFKERF